MCGVRSKPVVATVIYVCLCSHLLSEEQKAGGARPDHMLVGQVPAAAPEPARAKPTRSVATSAKSKSTSVSAPQVSFAYDAPPVFISPVTTELFLPSVGTVTAYPFVSNSASYGLGETYVPLYSGFAPPVYHQPLTPTSFGTYSSGSNFLPGVCY